MFNLGCLNGAYHETIPEAFDCQYCQQSPPELRPERLKDFLSYKFEGINFATLEPQIVDPVEIERQSRMFVNVCFVYGFVKDVSDWQACHTVIDTALATYREAHHEAVQV